MTKFKPNHLLTQGRLRSLLFYDPETGVFTWRKNRARVSAGTIAGSLMPEGYLRITVGGHRFMAHQLAWLYMTGEYVARDIDHRDTNRANNRWENLRRATRSQNNMNARLRSDNSTGFKGVTIKKGKRSKPYCAQVGVPGKGRPQHIGYFHTAEDAHSAYVSAAKIQFGEFARAK